MIRDRCPLGRLGRPEEMATSATFLTAGDNFLTGEVITADGGWTAFDWMPGDAWR